MFYFHKWCLVKQETSFTPGHSVVLFVTYYSWDFHHIQIVQTISTGQESNNNPNYLLFFSQLQGRVDNTNLICIDIHKCDLFACKLVLHGSSGNSAGEIGLLLLLFKFHMFNHPSIEGKKKKKGKKYLSSENLANIWIAHILAFGETAWYIL